MGGLYIAANVLLLAAYLEIRRRSVHRWAWKYLLYIFLAYNINGLDVTSGYYGDINVWFAFAGAVIYSFAIADRTDWTKSTITRCRDLSLQVGRWPRGAVAS